MLADVKRGKCTINRSAAVRKLLFGNGGGIWVGTARTGAVGRLDGAVDRAVIITGHVRRRGVSVRLRVTGR